jgi:type II secretory pathway pseudopilin PulG
MSYRSTKPKRLMAARPRGFVLVAVLVVFAVSLTLFGVWARAAVAQYRRARVQHVRLQATRLAEAGVRRAVAQYGLDRNYKEETWSVPAGVLDRSRAAEVRIRVAPSNEDRNLLFAATAEFPVNVLQRAQITKRIDLPISEPRETP